MASQLSTRRSSITPAQLRYLKILCQEAFCSLYETWTLLRIDSRHLENLDASYASTCISHLEAAKARNWTAPVASADDVARSERTKGRVARIRQLRSEGHLCSCQEHDGDETKCDMHSRMLDLPKL